MNITLNLKYDIKILFKGVFSITKIIDSFSYLNY